MLIQPTVGRVVWYRPGDPGDTSYDTIVSFRLYDVAPKTDCFEIFYRLRTVAKDRGEIDGGTLPPMCERFTFHVRFFRRVVAVD